MTKRVTGAVNAHIQVALQRTGQDEDRVREIQRRADVMSDYLNNKELDSELVIGVVCAVVRKQGS